jgi:hypothetical protein
LQNQHRDQRERRREYERLKRSVDSPGLVLAPHGLSVRRSALDRSAGADVGVGVGVSILGQERMFAWHGAWKQGDGIREFADADANAPRQPRGRKEVRVHVDDFAPTGT